MQSNKLPSRRTLLYLRARECIRSVDPSIGRCALHDMTIAAVESGLVYTNARDEIVFLAPHEVPR